MRAKKFESSAVSQNFNEIKFPMENEGGRHSTMVGVRTACPSVSGMNLSASKYFRYYCFLTDPRHGAAYQVDVIEPEIQLFAQKHSSVASSGRLRLEHSILINASHV